MTKKDSKWLWGSLPDVLGVLLLIAVGMWSLVAAEVSGGDPGPAMALAAAGAAVLAVSLLLGRLIAWIVPVAVLVGVGLIILQDGVAFFGRGPLDPPLGYENANGALFLQAAGAGTMWALVARSLAGRALGAAAAAGSAILAIVTGSTATMILLVLIPLSIVCGGSSRRVRVAALAGALIAASVLTMTALLGAGYATAERDGSITTLASGSLEERRLALWRDAIDLLVEHPLFGVGPGRFSVTSPVALSDRDARWAHNEPLELGAESGAPGLALLIIWLGWAFLNLAKKGGGYPAVVAVAALTGGVVQACIDYVWHFPAVPLAMLAVLGAGASYRPGHEDSITLKGRTRPA